MYNLMVVEKLSQVAAPKSARAQQRSSPITRRLYNMALDEFIFWFQATARSGFTKKETVNAWRVALEARGLARHRSAFAFQPFVSWQSRQRTTAYSRLSWLRG